MTSFFGQRWNAPVVDDGPDVLQVPTPVGEPCSACNRKIEEGDQGFIRPHVFADGNVGFMPVHRGCEMGTTVGHYFGLCSCTGWDDLYGRGKELVRRADTGELVPVEAGTTR